MINITLVLTVLLAACAMQEPGSPPAKDETLLDTAWQLTSLNGDALIEGSDITLRFGEDTIEGNGGCNTYGGSYTVSEDSLSLSDLYWTEMACMEPEGVMDQEQAYFAALNAAVSYQVDNDRLEIYDEAGTPTLVFAATER
jgi:putative lipoprotein